MMPFYPWLAQYPRSIAWDAQLSEDCVTDLLESAARKFPSNPALEWMGSVMKYKDLARTVEYAAAGLQALGVKKGTRVGMFMPNCPQFVVAYYAILKAGGIVVNINPLYAVPDIRHEMSDANVEIIFTLTLAPLFTKLQECIKDLPIRHVIHTGVADALPLFKRLAYRYTKKKDSAAVPRTLLFMAMSKLLASRAAFTPVQINRKEDIALLQYTGGTTGVPKAAMLTHANLVANTEQCGLWMDGLQEGKERMMAVIPFFHSFSMTAVMNLGIHSGAMLIIHPKFDLKPVLEDIQKKKPTLMCAVPTMFASIASYDKVKDYDLSSLKMGVSGGAPLPLEIRKRYEELTGSKLVEGYGLTETSPVVACNPLFGVNKEGSVGLPFPHTIIEIINADDQITPMQTGEVGEVCIRGPQVMKGYWNKPEETANVLQLLSPHPIPLPEGEGAKNTSPSGRGRNAVSISGEGMQYRLHTGDLGYIDAEGYVFIVDRLKDMIISGGYNVYPRTIEEAIYTHPDVLEAAVIAMPHAVRGQVPKAFVARKPGSALSDIELKKYLKEKLASFSLPAKIEFRESLPKTLIGKVDKKALKA